VQFSFPYAVSSLLNKCLKPFKSLEITLYVEDVGCAARQSSSYCRPRQWSLAGCWNANVRLSSVHIGKYLVTSSSQSSEEIYYTQFSDAWNCAVILVTVLHYHRYYCMRYEIQVVKGLMSVFWDIIQLPVHLVRRQSCKYNKRCGLCHVLEFTGLLTRREGGTARTF
jgi:hypothetical protein